MSDNIFKQNKTMTTIMKSYREYFSKSYEKRLMEAIHGQISADKQQEVVENAVEGDLNIWYETKLSDILTQENTESFVDNYDHTVEQWLESLNSEDALIALALHAAVICDDAMPRRILSKLYYSDINIKSRLLEICLQTNWASQNDNEENSSLEVKQSQLICCEFIKVLGQWQSAETLQKLLVKFCEYTNPDELISEAVGIYLINMGHAAIESIVEKTNMLMEIDPEKQIVHEYLLMALSGIGQSFKQENIFSALRKSMRKMKIPVIAAACIGDYGDPRGIRVLRSFLEANLPAVTPALYQEAVSAIKKLGGGLEGLEHPMFPSRQP